MDNSGIERIDVLIASKSKLNTLNMSQSIQWKASDGIVPYEDAVRSMEQRVAMIRAGHEAELVSKISILLPLVVSYPN